MDIIRCVIVHLTTEYTRGQYQVLFTSYFSNILLTHLFPHLLQL
uniref:Uncharacterized protein n=1 Tax=Arundo donax TaxID=35708 RepID=A0A0A9F5U1_ARUDO